MTDEKNVQQNIPLKLIHMNEIQATDIHWLWYPYIPYGKITIIQGDPGEARRLWCCIWLRSSHAER